MTGFIHLLIFIQTLKKQILTDDHKKEQIRKDSYKKKRFSQMITNRNKSVQINS